MLLQIILASVIHFGVYHAHFAKGMLDTLSTFTYPRVLDRLLLLLFYRDLLLALRTSKWRMSRFTLRSTRIDIGQIARRVYINARKAFVTASSIGKNKHFHVLMFEVAANLRVVILGGDFFY